LKALRAAFPVYRIPFPVGNEARSLLREARRPGNAARGAGYEPWRHCSSLQNPLILALRTISPARSRKPIPPRGLDGSDSMLHSASITTLFLGKLIQGRRTCSRASGDQGPPQRLRGFAREVGRGCSLTSDTPFARGTVGRGRPLWPLCGRGEKRSARSGERDHVLPQPLRELGLGALAGCHCEHRGDHLSLWSDEIPTVQAEEDHHS